jgi:hypothetical protein
MLSYTEPAITTAEADAYIQQIGDAEWSAADEVTKNAAIIRGQRYIATAYNARWWPAWEDGDEVCEPVKNAVAEAARVELTSPGALSPIVPAGPQKVLTGVKGITWQIVNDGSGRRIAFLPTVDALLAGLVAPAVGNTSVSTLLRA